MEIRGHVPGIMQLLEKVGITAAGGCIRRMAEIGVAQGKTSAYLLAKHPNLHLLMIDPYTECITPRVTTAVATMETYMVQAKRATDPYRDRRRLMVMNSLEAANMIRWTSLDLVFIDGNHSYESVKADIDAWEPKLQSKGILAGHDYNRGHCGVMKAVDEWASTSRISVAFLPNRIWWAKKL